MITPITMLSLPELLARWGAIALLIAINAFFVTAEFSIVSVRRSRISQLVDAGDLQALTVQELQQSLDRLLSTTQLGITLSSLALGWIGESALVEVMQSGLRGFALTPAMSHSLAILITFLLLAYLQIVLGELCPKSVALLHAEEIARFVAPFSVAIARFFNPFIWVLNQSTRWFLYLLGIRYAGQGWYNQVSSEELQLIIATSTESSGLEADERELLSNVFEFGEVTADEIMIRRPQIIAIESNASVKELLDEVAESRHSRYVVVDESLDDIAGFIHLKDIAEPLANGSLSLEGAITPWIHPPQFVPEYTPLAELLPLMQKSGQHMAIVVDEFGATAGLVTIQDLITQIIGETPEVGDEAITPIRWLNPQTAIVQAQLDLEEVNEELGIRLPLLGEYRSLGGFLFYQWQQIPLVGETLTYGNCELTVISADGPRLQDVQVHCVQPIEEQPAESLEPIVESPPEASTPQLKTP
jgi:CBS domain containing-hemolysin-like protein